MVKCQGEKKHSLSPISERDFKVGSPQMELSTDEIKEDVSFDAVE